MANRANPTIIGAFVVGAVALIVGGLVVFGSVQWLRRPPTYVMFFDSSVTGLRVGAPVEFRGVKVGEVSKIQARWGSEWIAVYITLDTRGVVGHRPDDANVLERAIEGGGKAQLRMQSLITGQLYVAFDLFPAMPIRFVGLDTSVPEIPTVPTQLQLLGDRLEKVFKGFESAQLDKLATSAGQTVDDIGALARSPELRAAVRAGHELLVSADKLVQRVDREAGPLLASLKETSDIARRLMAQVDGEVPALRAVLKDAQQLMAGVRAEVGPVASTLRSAGDSAKATLETARATLASVDRTVEEDSRLGYQLGRTLQELTAAARALRALADYLDRHPESLLTGKRRTGGN
jgi:paraquat-inducible protein B